MQGSSPRSAVFLSRLASNPIIAVLRGLDPQTTARHAADLLVAGSIHVEVTIQDSTGMEALKRTVTMKGLSGCFVGAGSVTSVELAEQAIDVGAQFLVSPGLSPAVIEIADAHDVPILPGVATPSEVQSAHDLGIRTVKLFPAAQLGGPAYLRALAAPFPFMRFVPTGGVDFSNAPDYLAAGALAVGIGSGLTRPGGVEAFHDWMKGFNGHE